jgi:hypothetical protein
VIVWLLPDVDRNWSAEVPHSVPVAYCLKGYSLAGDTMRSMHDEVLDACYEAGLDVVCSAFDGQWCTLSTRGETGELLTILQLQRDIWNAAKGNLGRTYAKL